MSNMPHTGFQRLDAGTTTVIMDTGPPPPPNVSQDAHAGCLSFELSSGPSRIVVNCGMPSTGRDNWRAFARYRGAFDPDLSRNVVVPVRRTVGDEATVAGRADHQRTGECGELSRGSGERRPAAHLA